MRYRSIADRLIRRVRLRFPFGVARSIPPSTPRCWRSIPSGGVASIRAPQLKRFIGVDTRASSNAECNAPPSVLLRRPSVLTSLIRALQNEESSGFSPSFSSKSRAVAVLKSPSVLPPTLISGIFLGRLFFSATKGAFFDNIFFLWFGSHMFLSYNNMSEISPVIFSKRTRLRNP